MARSMIADSLPRQMRAREEMRESVGVHDNVDPAEGLAPHLPPIFGWAPPVACLPYRVLQGGQTGYA